MCGGQYEKVAASMGISLAELRARRAAAHASGGGDAAPSGAALTAMSAWARLRALLLNVRAGVYNWTLGLWLDPLPYVSAAVPMNHAAIIDTLLRVHGHEIFVDGFFNGVRGGAAAAAGGGAWVFSRARVLQDPHPGNILLCPEPRARTGFRLGLIDYGQVRVRDCVSVHVGECHPTARVCR